MATKDGVDGSGGGDHGAKLDGAVTPDAHAEVGREHVTVRPQEAREVLEHAIRIQEVADALKARNSELAKPLQQWIGNWKTAPLLARRATPTERLLSRAVGEPDPHRDGRGYLAG